VGNTVDQGTVGVEPDFAEEHGGTVEVAGEDDGLAAAVLKQEVDDEGGEPAGVIHLAKLMPGHALAANQEVFGVNFNEGPVKKEKEDSGGEEKQDGGYGDREKPQRQVGGAQPEGHRGPSGAEISSRWKVARHL